MRRLGRTMAGKLVEERRFWLREFPLVLARGSLRQWAVGNAVAMYSLCSLDNGQAKVKG